MGLMRDRLSPIVCDWLFMPGNAGKQEQRGIIRSTVPPFQTHLELCSILFLFQLFNCIFSLLTLFSITASQTEFIWYKGGHLGEGDPLVPTKQSSAHVSLFPLFPGKLQSQVCGKKAGTFANYSATLRWWVTAKRDKSIRSGIVIYPKKLHDRDESGLGVARD